MKTTPQLYRDCLRLVIHLAGANSPKSIAIRGVVGKEFRKHQNVKDELEIEKLKFK
jgi:hypothetical protein